jgi:SAM-dependent methyltransferase
MSDTPHALHMRYTCDQAAFSSKIGARFRALELDLETEQYFERVAKLRHGRVRTALHRGLRHFFSDFDVNGLLNMYPMHLLSTEQWQALLGKQRIPQWLDVGAGSGDVTLTLRPLCDEVRATEMSRVMAHRLRRLGIPCERIDVALTELPPASFDLITCLNVLDRCAYPRTLLRNVRSALKPGGRLVVALALPYSPFFYEGAQTPDPLERLHCTAQTWEAATELLITRDLQPLGFEIETFTRAPYLSGGDTKRAIYELDDVIVVTRVAA